MKEINRIEEDKIDRVETYIEREERENKIIDAHHQEIQNISEYNELIRLDYLD